MVNPLHQASPNLMIQQPAESQQKIFQGFNISSDGKSAIKILRVGGKELKFTVFFPSNMQTDGRRHKYLQHFNDDQLNRLGQYALDLGLGQAKKEARGKLEAIVLNTTSSGSLNEILKKYSKLEAPKQISVEYYKERLNMLQHSDSLAQDKELQDKLKKYEGKIAALQQIQEMWKKNFSPSQEQPETVTPDQTAEEETLQPTKTRPADDQHDEEKLLSQRDRRKKEALLKKDKSTPPLRPPHKGNVEEEKTSIVHEEAAAS
ncbi:hypothetical protein [Neochlamydia sp. S13]|uniref:hypothetical protein n=1 Tax=Neochlamydia sp. S13 TaxID=1353976 RepID=UPI0005A84EB7|nr:hypothetical protein [Neochlamydia sp. S13]BBI16299.1 hypothetical protein NCS13_1_0104 [Neochlamydia sp. S13]